MFLFQSETLRFQRLVDVQPNSINSVSKIRSISHFLLATLSAIVITVFGFVSDSTAADYHVGPGQAYTTIGAVPWYTLGGGDTVYIHYKSTPYYEKVLISGQGSPNAWLRVIGVLGPNGERPIISGANATTSRNMHWRWADPTQVEMYGIVHVGPRADADVGGGATPQYVEISNLQIQDGGNGYRFTTEGGANMAYGEFTSCIYTRSVQHLLINNNVINNCGIGFYNWTADGVGNAANTWWGGLQRDTVIRGNYFYDNGVINQYYEHQAYTESDGVIYEYNRFGPNKAGSLGSHLKDRSGGTVIRYNIFETAPVGWMIDLPEPENGFNGIATKDTYKQTFVYGNIFIGRANGSTPYWINFIHWNEDHNVGVGRATVPGAKLFFYDNTLLSIANQTDVHSDPLYAVLNLFNETWGAYDCPPGGRLPGNIDVRNNIISFLPRTPGAAIPTVHFDYCAQVGFDFGKNWFTPGIQMNGAPTTGLSNIFSPSSNNPGYVDVNSNDVHLVAGASAAGLGGTLAPEVTNNYLGLDLTPNRQYVYHLTSAARANSGVGSDLGALSNAGATFSPCDINGDGSTNVVDVQHSVNQALGFEPCTADLNRDGICDIVDLQRDVNAVIGGQCVSS